MTESPAGPAGPARCSACGALLAAAVDDGGVVTVGEFQVAFRRHTDHVVCPRCLASYRVEHLRDRRISA
jgi:hypothetical protein